MMRLRRPPSIMGAVTLVERTTRTSAAVALMAFCSSWSWRLGSLTTSAPRAFRPSRPLFSNLSATRIFMLLGVYWFAFVAPHRTRQSVLSFIPPAPQVPRLRIRYDASPLGHASRCAVLRMPLFAHVLAVAGKGPSMQALVKLAATLRLSLASSSLDGSSCSLTSAAHSSACPTGMLHPLFEAFFLAQFGGPHAPGDERICRPPSRRV